MAPSHITERLLPHSFYFLIQSALEKLLKILGKVEEEEEPEGEILGEDSTGNISSTSQKAN